MAKGTANRPFGLLRHISSHTVGTRVLLLFNVTGAR